MKKSKAILTIFVLFLIVYFLQANFFTWFNIGGIMPNLFVILVLFIGLFASQKLGIFIGLIIDTIVGKGIGFSSLFLALIGLLGEYFDKNFSKDSKITIILMGVIATSFYEVGMYIVNIAKYGAQVEIGKFLFILLIENIFNSLLIIIFYPLMKKVGYYLEDVFKKKQLLTRYF